MRIRTQSIILIAGVIVMPLLVISGSLVYEQLSRASREAHLFAQLEMDEATPAQSRIHRVIDHKPKDLDMAIADPQGKVIYSTIAGIGVGDDFSKAILRTASLPNRSRVLFFDFFPRLPAGYLALTSSPRSSLLPGPEFHDYVRISLLTLFTLLAFVSAMCIIIIRSITRSVLALEAATRKVASGELGSPISVDGPLEIASLSRSLDAMRIELKDDHARRARFIMGISHDLKTPLALIKGYTEALEEELGEIDGSAKSYMGIIADKTDQLESMIDDLIDFERVDTGEWSRGLKDVDLSSVLRFFARRVEADALLLGRSLAADIDIPAGSMVRMDERLATRALENLVNNALRYTSPGGRVQLSAKLESQSSRYLIRVSDDGPGISAADLPHIFEPFYRGSNSRREQGMGLGLSIVKTVVESHGWTIDARPGEEAGASFLISIPV